MTATVSRTADGDAQEQRQIISLGDADPEGFMPIYEAFQERFDAIEGDALVGKAGGDYALIDRVCVTGLVHTGAVDSIKTPKGTVPVGDSQPVDGSLSRVKRGRLGTAGTYEVSRRGCSSFFAARFLIPVAQFLETPVEDLTVSIYPTAEVLRIEVEGTEWAILVAPYLDPEDR